MLLKNQPTGYMTADVACGNLIQFYVCSCFSCSDSSAATTMITDVEVEIKIRNETNVFCSTEMFFCPVNDTHQVKHVNSLMAQIVLTTVHYCFN